MAKVQPRAGSLQDRIARHFQAHPLEDVDRTLLARTLEQGEESIRGAVYNLRSRARYWEDRIKVVREGECWQFDPNGQPSMLPLGAVEPPAENGLPVWHEIGVGKDDKIVLRGPGNKLAYLGEEV